MSEEQTLIADSDDLEMIREFANGCWKFSANVRQQKRHIEERIQIIMRDIKECQVLLPSSIEECITLLRSIADNIELFHRRATIANIAGSSAGIAGGITTIVGLALTPFTFGASLIVSLVGISVASAGGLTGAVSSIADTANIYKNGKRVEKIIKDIDRDIKCMETLLESIREQLEDIRRLQGVNKFEIMTASTRGASIAIGITRVAELVSVTSNVARGAQLAARGLQALTAVSGVLAAAFLLVDIGLVTKNAIDLRNGATLEKAQKIRDVADDLERQFGNLQAEVTEVQKLFRQCIR